MVRSLPALAEAEHVLARLYDAANDITEVRIPRFKGRRAAMQRSTAFRSQAQQDVARAVELLGTPTQRVPDELTALVEAVQDSMRRPSSDRNQVDGAAISDASWFPLDAVMTERYSRDPSAARSAVASVIADGPSRPSEAIRARALNRAEALRSGDRGTLPDDALRALRSVVDKPDLDIRMDDIHRLERIATLPSPIRADVPMRLFEARVVGMPRYPLAQKIFHELRWSVFAAEVSRSPIERQRVTVTSMLDEAVGRRSAPGVLPDVIVADLRAGHFEMFFHMLRLDTMPAAVREWAGSDPATAHLVDSTLALIARLREEEILVHYEDVGQIRSNLQLIDASRH